MRRSNSKDGSRASLSSCTTTRSSAAATPSATRRWRGSERAKELLDLVVGRREIAQRHRDRDGFLGHVLEGDLELLARPQGRKQVWRDRRRCVAAAVLAGLDWEIDRLAVVDLEL